MQLGELTWVEAERQTGKVVVMPIGSLEQHGHHLPLLTDSMIGSEIARRAEAALGDEALFLPLLPIGASDHHLSFGGTVSIGLATYTQVIEQMVECLIAGGFRRIFVLNSHSGNIVPAQAALTQVQIRHRESKPDLYLTFASWFDLAGEALAQLDGFRQKKIIHACEWETSQIQAVRPDLVNEGERIGARRPFDSRFWTPDHTGPSRVFVARTMEQGSVTGGYGYPELATPEKGERLFATAAAEVIAFVREFAGWPTLKGV